MDLLSEERILKTLRDFRDHNITLVEWETPLLRRLGYPLTEKPVSSRGAVTNCLLLISLDRICFS